MHVTVDGARVAITQAGSGESVVLLHYPQNRHVWTPAIAALVDRYRVIALLRMGRVRSPAIAHELVAAIGGAELVEISTARHFVVDERPAEVCAALERLLERRAPAFNAGAV